MLVCFLIPLLATATVVTQPQPISFNCKEKNVEALHIVATAEGPIYYQWQKYDPVTNSWISPSNRAVNTTSPNLTFSVITVEDQGVYHCIVTNDDGSIISNDVNITVHGKVNIA